MSRLNVETRPENTSRFKELKLSEAPTATFLEPQQETKHLIQQGLVSVSAVTYGLENLNAVLGALGSGPMSSVRWESARVTDRSGGEIPVPWVHTNGSEPFHQPNAAWVKVTMGNGNTISFSKEMWVRVKDCIRNNTGLDGIEAHVWNSNSQQSVSYVMNQGGWRQKSENK